MIILYTYDYNFILFSKYSITHVSHHNVTCASRVFLFPTYLLMCKHIGTCTHCKLLFVHIYIVSMLHIYSGTCVHFI